MSVACCAIASRRSTLASQRTERFYELKNILLLTDWGFGGKAALTRGRGAAKMNKTWLTVIEMIEELPHNVHMLDTEETST